MPGKNIPHMECVSKPFGISCTDPLCYSNINLRGVLSVRDSDVLLMIRRSRGILSSLVLGNRLSKLTHRFLEPLQHIGSQLKTLDLLGNSSINDPHLREALSFCPNLTNLDLSDCWSEVDAILNMAGSHCPLLERLFYASCEGYNSPRSNKISDNNLATFLGKCTKVKVLGLPDVFISDKQIAHIIQQLGTLRGLYLSRSLGFTGSFLLENGVTILDIQCMHLDKAEDIMEKKITAFVKGLEDGLFKSLRQLFVTGHKGFERRTHRSGLKE